MKKLIAKVAISLKKELEARGYEVAIYGSRQSESRYVYANTQAEEDYREIAIRISNHPNPAHRWDRVKSCGDRAEACHIEVRLDRAKAWKWAIAVATAHLSGEIEIDPNRPRFGPQGPQDVAVQASEQTAPSQPLPQLHEITVAKEPWPVRLAALKVSHPEQVRLWEQATGWRRKELRRDLEALSIRVTL